MDFDQFLQLAAGVGYQAICMRASLGGIQTPLEQLRDMSRKAKAAGLTVSLVTGNFDTPANRRVERWTSTNGKQFPRMIYSTNRCIVRLSGRFSRVSAA